MIITANAKKYFLTSLIWYIVIPMNKVKIVTDSITLGATMGRFSKTRAITDAANNNNGLMRKSNDIIILTKNKRRNKR